jgi:hypothetical protein
MIVMFRESHSKALLIAGRAALLGFATLLVSMTSAIGQEAPDREDSRRDSDEDRREVVDLADVEYTAGPRHKGESDRDRPEHRAARREEGRKGPKDEDESRERAHAEMRHAQQALIRAAHRIVELDERASAHHEGPRGPKPGDRAMEGRRGPGREDGRGERHAEEGRGPKHEGERAEHRGPKDGRPDRPHDGRREHEIDRKHHAETSKAEGSGVEAKSGSGGEEATIRGEIALAEADVARARDRLAWSTKMKEKGHVPDSTRIADDLNLRKSKFALEQAQTKKNVYEKYSKAKMVKEGHANDAQAHHDVDARINHIEKKLDELIKIVHEMKAHEAKEGKEKSKK